MVVKISGNSSPTAPSFAGDDGDSGLHASANEVQLVTNSTVAMTVDSSQRVGIGSSSPSYLLDCKSTGATNVARFLTGATTSSEVAQFGRSDQAVNLSIDYDGAGSMGIGTTTAHPFNLKTGAVTRATIDTSGRLGIGTTTPSSPLHISANAEAQLKLNRAITTTGACFMQFTNSGGNYYIGPDSSTGSRGFATGGAPYGLVLVTESAYPITLGTANTERMRITSAGIITAYGRLQVSGGPGVSAYPGNGEAQYSCYTAYGATILGQGSSYDISFLSKGGNFAGYVATGASSITTSSDERLKENFAPITGALDKVGAMRHETGNYKTDPDRTISFLIAQDVDQHWPYAVDKTNPEMWGVNYNWIVPLHGAAIAELKTLVETQAAQIQALEARISALEGGN